jgi:hypothetical protein
VTLNPVDDAYVAGEVAGSNFGQTTDLQSDMSPVRESYLKFDLTPLAGLNITQATLRMFVTSGSGNAQNVKQVTDIAWTENALTFNNRPAKAATITTFTPGSTTGAYIQVPITSAVASGAGSFISIALDNSGSDGFTFNSAESAANKVELVVQWSGGGAAGTPSPSPVPTTTTAPTATAAPTATPTGGALPPGGLILNPVDDAYVAGELPTSNFGQTTDLQSDMSPVRESYLKFDLTSLAGVTVTEARLRMFVTSGSANAQNIKQVSNTTWTENALNFNNRPAKGATIATFTHGSTTGVWREVIITSHVAANAGALMSLAVDSSGSDGFDFNSAEAAANRVELVIN